MKDNKFWCPDWVLIVVLLVIILGALFSLFYTMAVGQSVLDQLSLP